MQQDKAFNYDQDFKNIDFRKHPELYRVGKGEQGVLLVEPYKSELLPCWKFKTPEIAQQAAKEIYKLFLAYGRQQDFAGMDMARKFLQMGYTRSRRYANHKSGQKYKGLVPADKKGVSGAHGRPQLPREEDPVKAASAAIFYEQWQRALRNPTYKKLMKAYNSRFR
jgi:hypothetical protein